MNPFELASHGPVIPVIVIHRIEDAVPMAQALVDGGVRVLEVTLRTPVALQCMEAIARAPALPPSPPPPPKNSPGPEA